MNASPLAEMGETLALLALESLLLVGSALFAERFIKSGFWKKALWQSALVSLGGLFFLELGVGRGVFSWPRHRDSASAPPAQVDRMKEPEPAPNAALKMTAEFREKVAARLAARNKASASPALPASGAAQLPAKPALPVAKPGWREAVALAALVSWTLGGLFLLLRTVVSLVALSFFRWRGRGVRFEPLRRQLDELRQRAGFRRQVRLVESPLLKTPIAFGVFFPAIGLPAGFASRFSEPKQRAMLAHELAHLEANDPAWRLGAEIVTALFCWHPAVWRARGRFLAACETAADEASLLMENDPETLAECLVELGREVSRARQFGWIGMEGSGFKSDLAKRV